MPKYEVTYGIIGSIVFEVEAESKESAKEKADEMLEDHNFVGDNVDWDFVEWNGHGPGPQVPEFTIIEVED